MSVEETYLEMKAKLNKIVPDFELRYKAELRWRSAEKQPRPIRTSSYSVALDLWQKPQRY
jgi:hypothetical protein